MGKLMSSVFVALAAAVAVAYEAKGTYEWRVAEDVYRTSFSNGESILSNYNSAPVTVDGREIPALGYVIGGVR